MLPEQGFILYSNSIRAHKVGSAALVHYPTYPNYQNSWRRHGISDDETSSTSDCLIAALLDQGEAEQIAVRVKELIAFGADLADPPVITNAEVNLGKRSLSPTLRA